jgi:transposase-like protein
MDNNVFTAFMEQIAYINGAQKRVLIQEMMKKTANSPIPKGDIGPICPICSTKPTRTHGSFGNKVRYICDTCGTTVNEGSHLITHRSRNLEKWPKFLELLMEGHSVREIALQLNVSPKTSFLWRKKVTSLLPELKAFLEKNPKTSKKANQNTNERIVKSNTTPHFVSEK